MDVLTLLATLRRRWIIVVTVVGLSVAAVAAMVLMIERPYRMAGSYMVGTESLTRPGERELPEEDGELAAAGDRQQNADADAGDAGPPVDAEQPDDAEPGESDESDGGQTIVPGVNSAAIGEAVQDGATVEQIREQGADANYTVIVEDNLLRVVATSSSREEVVPTVVGVLDAIRSEVAQRQAGDAPDDGQVVVETLAVPTEASIRVKELDGGEQEFSAFGTVRLVRPSDPEIFNPYESFAFSMRVVEEVLLSDQGKARIVEAGGAPEPQGEDDPGYAIHYDERDPAPVAYLSATGTEPERVERTFRAIAEVANQELDMRQAALGVDSEGRTGLQELSVSDVPEPASRELARAAITVLGIGAVAAVGLALLVDNVAHGLQRRRDAALHETDETPRSSGAAAPADTADTDTASPNRDEATDEFPGSWVAAAPADTDAASPNGEAMPPPVVDQEQLSSPGTRSSS